MPTYIEKYAPELLREFRPRALDVETKLKQKKEFLLLKIAPGGAYMELIPMLRKKSSRRLIRPRWYRHLLGQCAAKPVTDSE